MVLARPACLYWPSCEVTTSPRLDRSSQLPPLKWVRYLHPHRCAVHECQHVFLVLFFSRLVLVILQVPPWIRAGCFQEDQRSGTLPWAAPAAAARWHISVTCGTGLLECGECGVKREAAYRCSPTKAVGSIVVQSIKDCMPAHSSIIVLQLLFDKPLPV